MAKCRNKRLDLSKITNFRGPIETVARKVGAGKGNGGRKTDSDESKKGRLKGTAAFQ